VVLKHDAAEDQAKAAELVPQAPEIITVFTVTVSSGTIEAMSSAAEERGWPVEGLAARTGLPVRTIREYQTLRILEPPVRRGRVAFYGQAHLRRLELIARLQERGYSLAGIRDLFDAWAAGRDLAGILAGPDGAVAEEAPAVLDQAGLQAAVSHLPASRRGELVSLGAVIQRTADECCVPSPSLLGLLDDAIANGVSVDGALAVAGAISTGVRGIAGAVAAIMGEELGDRADDEAVVALLRRGRVLVAQATSRLLLHELGLALAEPAASRDGPAMARLADRLHAGRVPAPPANARTPGRASKESHGE
jgi:DNA-binding transcriptional MerR regulator